MLEACVRSRLLYSAQSWDLSASELSRLETVWHGFLRKMVTNGFKRMNLPAEHLKARKEGGKRGITVPEPEDLNWSYVYSNSDLRKITTSAQC